MDVITYPCLTHREQVAHICVSERGHNRFGVKPLPYPLPNHCQMDPQEQTSVKLRQKYKSFLSKVTFEKLLLKTSAILFWYQYVRPVMLNTCNIAACTEPVVNQNLCLYNGYGSCDSSITMTTHIKYSWLRKNGYKVGMLHMKHYSRLTYCVMNFYLEILISFTCIHYSERHGVSDHWQLDCLYNSLFRPRA